jgi:hypothetical protein
VLLLRVHRHGERLMHRPAIPPPTSRCGWFPISSFQRVCTRRNAFPAHGNLLSGPLRAACATSTTRFSKNNTVAHFKRRGQRCAPAGTVGCAAGTSLSAGCLDRRRNIRPFPVVRRVSRRKSYTQGGPAAPATVSPQGAGWFIWQHSSVERGERRYVAADWASARTLVACAVGTVGLVPSLVPEPANCIGW